MDPQTSRPAQAGNGRRTPDVIVQDPAWRRRVPGAERVAARAAAITGATATVILASDRAVAQLNARHRGRSRPTNVLSFPGSAEIVLALGVLCREADAAKQTRQEHLAHLVMHGALHLGGHGHHAAGDARRMERAETRLLRRLRLPDPWRRA